MKALAAAGILTAVLAGCGGMQREKPIESRRLVTQSLWTLSRAGDSPNAQVRCQALEVLAQVRGTTAGPIFYRFLKDKDPMVRFAAAMAIGDVRHAAALAAIRRMATPGVGESDRRTYCGVLYAMHCLGDDTYTRRLGELLFDREVEVRCNAALVLGRMKLPAARPLLQSALDEEVSHEREGPAKLALVEALARLGDARCKLAMESYTRLQLDYRLPAILALPECQTPNAADLLESLMEDPFPQVRVAAAGALGRLGRPSDRAYALCLQAVRDPRKLFDRSPRDLVEYDDAGGSAVVQLGVLGLGWMASPAAVADLEPLLAPQAGIDIRSVAAAGSILRLLGAVEAAPAAPAAKP